MRKFYIIYSDGYVIQGKCDCLEGEFKKRFILPLGTDVFSWYLGEMEEQLEELTLETLKQLI